MAERPRTEMTPEDHRRLRLHLTLTQADMAARTGRSLTVLRGYERGTAPIPSGHALACAALYLGVAWPPPGWPPTEPPARQRGRHDRAPDAPPPEAPPDRVGSPVVREPVFGPAVPGSV